jgi:hypothetical protein
VQASSALRAVVTAAASPRNVSIWRSPITRRVSSVFAQMSPPRPPSSFGTGLYENV